MLIIPAQIVVSALFIWYILWMRKQIYVIKKEVFSLMDVDVMEKSNYMSRDIHQIV
jgi:hypothetical protein